LYRLIVRDLSDGLATGWRPFALPEWWGADGLYYELTAEQTVGGKTWEFL
jgi:hypothetical protein